MSKAKRNPIPTFDDKCSVCGVPYAALHEVFYGTGNRQKSIKWGMQIRLCFYHHNNPSNTTSNPHFNKDADRRLKEKYQHIFEEQRMIEGTTKTAARELFCREFGRNYIDG